MASVGALAMLGCAAEQGNRQATVDGAVVARLASQAQTPAPFQDTSIVQSRPNQVYIGANVRASSNDRSLPQEWRSRNVTFVNSRPQDFRTVLAMVSNTTKLPVSFSAAVSRQVQTVAGSALADSTSIRAGGSPPTLAAGPIPAGFDVSAAQALVAGGGGGMAAAPSGEGMPSGRMNVNFTGTLSQFLDQIASNFGVSWSMDGERIVFASTNTEVFDIPALPVVLKLATQFASQGPSVQGGAGGISTGGTGGGGGTGNSDSVQSSTAVDLWKEINAALKSIVSQGQGGLEVSGSSGTVTVTGTRDVVQNVRRYVSEINSRLSKQVVMSMAVYAVSLTRNDSVSSNVAPLLQAGGLQIFGANAGVPFPGNVPGITGRTGPAIGLIVDPVRNPTNSLAGSQAVVDALSRAGEVSVVNSQSVTTMNNIPVPFRDVNTRGYAAQISTTVVGGVTGAIPQTSIVPGSVQTGYSMRLTPRINNDGTVQIEYALDLSELNGPQEGFRTFTTGSQTIQLPDVNSRNGVGQARIPAGATLVLTGLERTRVDSTRTGPVNPNLWMFGGQRGGGVRRELIVITITPEIIDLGQPRASR